jgi:hypothetical protein
MGQKRGGAVRIGFLFNHYAPHQVPHAAPFAFELSRRHPEFEVTVACSSDAELELARQIGTLYPGSDCRLVRLRTTLLDRVADTVLSHWSFRRKTAVLRANRAFFETLDVLVAPERHCVKLLSMLETDIKLVHTRHGAGDREGSYDERLRSFDFMLLPGHKSADRLLELGLATPEEFAVTGSCKLEVFPSLARERPRLFDDDRPVVIYAPHFERGVSSWQTMGRDVLEFFASSDRYNLIFSPHILLFKRRLRHRARLRRGFAEFPNIHIDLGSLASIDMSHLRAADIYLGDASSQVYEFLCHPRPCVFLNAGHSGWQNDPHFLHWNLGEVVGDVGTQLGSALDRAFECHPRYVERQRELVAYTYYSDGSETASARGAEAIAQFARGDSRSSAR